MPEAQKQGVLPQAAKARPNHPGRDKLPEHLERREEIIPCWPPDCHCSKCGVELPVIGYETREDLACEPARFWVRVIKREKRGSHCLEEQGVVTAVVRAQAAALVAGLYLQADETPVPCQTPEKTGCNHRAFIWEYCGLRKPEDAPAPPEVLAVTE